MVVMYGRPSGRPYHQANDELFSVTITRCIEHLPALLRWKMHFGYPAHTRHHGRRAYERQIVHRWTTIYFTHRHDVREPACPRTTALLLMPIKPDNLELRTTSLPYFHRRVA